MTNTNDVVRNLGITAIKTEIQRRNPVDPKAVEDAVASRLRIDTLGQPYVVDKSGVRDDYKCLEQFLDEVARDRPELFQNSRPSSPGGKTPSSVKNPFDRKSPHYNLSEGMKLYRTDPETARELAFRAGMKL